MEEKRQEPIRRINRLVNEWEALYRQSAVKLKTSDSVLQTMYQLYEQGGSCPLSELCAGSCLSKQTVNSALRKLEGEGILYLEPYRGRSKLVRLTEKGEAYARRTAARVFAAESAAFQDWPREEIERYLQLMKKYVDSFRVQIEKMEGNVE